MLEGTALQESDFLLSRSHSVFATPVMEAQSAPGFPYPEEELIEEEGEEEQEDQIGDTECFSVSESVAVGVDRRVGFSARRAVKRSLKRLLVSFTLKGRSTRSKSRDTASLPLEDEFDDGTDAAEILQKGRQLVAGGKKRASVRDALVMLKGEVQEDASSHASEAPAASSQPVFVGSRRRSVTAPPPVLLCAIEAARENPAECRWMSAGKSWGTGSCSAWAVAAEVLGDFSMTSGSSWSSIPPENGSLDSMEEGLEEEEEQENNWSRHTADDTEECCFAKGGVNRKTAARHSLRVTFPPRRLSRISSRVTRDVVKGLTMRDTGSFEACLREAVLRRCAALSLVQRRKQRKSFCNAKKEPGDLGFDLAARFHGMPPKACGGLLSCSDDISTGVQDSMPGAETYVESGDVTARSALGDAQEFSPRGVWSGSEQNVDGEKGEQEQEKEDQEKQDEQEEQEEQEKQDEQEEQGEEQEEQGEAQEQEEETEDEREKQEEQKEPKERQMFDLGMRIVETRDIDNEALGLKAGPVGSERMWSFSQMSCSTHPPSSRGLSEEEEFPVYEAPVTVSPTLEECIKQAVQQREARRRDQCV